MLSTPVAPMSQRARQSAICVLASAHRRLAPGMYRSGNFDNVLETLVGLVAGMTLANQVYPTINAAPHFCGVGALHSDIRHLVHVGRCLELYFMHCGERQALQPPGTIGPYAPRFSTAFHNAALENLWRSAFPGRDMPRPRLMYPPSAVDATVPKKHQLPLMCDPVALAWRRQGKVLLVHLDAMLENSTLAVVDLWAPLVVHWVQVAELLQTGTLADRAGATAWVADTDAIIATAAQRWEHAVLQRDIQALWKRTRGRHTLSPIPE